MDHSTLGKILATVITAAIDAGAIAANSKGVVDSPQALAALAQGFLSIWLSHPASSFATANVPPKG